MLGSVVVFYVFGVQVPNAGTDPRSVLSHTADDQKQYRIQRIRRLAYLRYPLSGSSIPPGSTRSA